MKTLNEKNSELSLTLINGNISDFKRRIKKMRKKTLTQYIIYCYNYLNKDNFEYNLTIIDNALHD